jgi:hypothetical protein
MPYDREQTLRMLAASRIYQARYDSAFEPWGISARQIRSDEDIDHYRRDLAVAAKRLLPPDHQLARVQYRQQADSVLDNFEPMLLSAVKQHAHANDTVPFDLPLREVPVVDPNTGQKIKTFVGERSFVHDFKAPVRRVLSFTTYRGRYDAVQGRWVA